jgi:hypothetical protein
MPPPPKDPVDEQVQVLKGIKYKGEEQFLVTSALGLGTFLLLLFVSIYSVFTINKAKEATSGVLTKFPSKILDLFLTKI